MARRSDHNREELAALILEAARRIVAEEGLRGLAARKLAERVGYAPGTLYNVFVNMDEVILRLNAASLSSLRDALAAIPKEGSPREHLMRLSFAYLDFVRQKGSSWSAIFEHRLPEGEIVPDWYDARIEALLSLAEEALAPYFSPADAESRREAAVALWAALHGLGNLATADKLSTVTGKSPERILVRLVGSFLDGLK
jgi:AcrR family transcriptional regulator